MAYRNRYYNSRYAYSQPNAYASARPRPTSNAGYPASDKQINFLTSLLSERVLEDAAARAAIVQEIADGTINSTQASWAIETLLASPRKPKPVDPNAPEPVKIPNGRYALPQDGDTQHKFYRVNSPDKGKWAGYTFVSEITGAQGDGNERQVRDRNEREAILARLAVDPQKAMADYGHLTNKCGKCHALLTDEVSVAQGIGPQCAKVLGWA